MVYWRSFQLVSPSISSAINCSSDYFPLQLFESTRGSESHNIVSMFTSIYYHLDKFTLKILVYDSDLSPGKQKIFERQRLLKIATVICGYESFISGDEILCL